MKKLLSILCLIGAVAFVACNDDNDSPRYQLSENIKNYIAANYPGAVVTDYDKERNHIEVDIVENGATGSVRKELYFSTADQWLRTEWDVRVADLPEAVVNAVNAQYPDYRIDDADYVQAPGEEYYEIEIEKGNKEPLLKVALDGSSVEMI